MKLRVLFTACFAWACLTACDKIETDARHDVREDIILTKSQIEYVRSGNYLGEKMMNQLFRHGEGECLLSPLSTQIALGLLAAGSDGNTKDQIVDLLGFGRDVPSTMQYLSSLSEQLKLADKRTSFTSSNLVLLNTASGLELNPEYKESVSSFSDVCVLSYDFTKEHEKAVSESNAWSASHTNGQISRLLSDKDVQSDHIAYMMNALYFKSSWSKPFDSKNTKSEPFTDSDMNLSSVSMMHQQGVFKYYENAELKAVQMLYGNGAFCYTAILPDDPSSLQSVCDMLEEGLLQDVQLHSAYKSVAVSLPKYKQEVTVNMPSLCVALGLDTPFSSESSDFGHLVKNGKNMRVSDFSQILTIEVDESGSEAAAVSKIEAEIATGPAAEDVKIFKADHPFIYAISETSTQTLLFLGVFGN